MRDSTSIHYKQKKFRKQVEYRVPPRVPKPECPEKKKMRLKYMESYKKLPNKEKYGYMFEKYVEVMEAQNVQETKAAI